MFSLRLPAGIRRIFPVSALGIALGCWMAIGEAHADSTCGVLSATYLLTALNSRRVICGAPTDHIDGRS